jgi:hypothetical protein
MLLRPLFFTSFLIDDQLADDGLTAKGPVVMSSASSKTALAAAFMLARREGAELIALTSPGNVEFVDGLGVFARTVPYEDIGSLAREPVTYVDFSSNAEVRAAVHDHYGDEMLYSMAVGLTHWEKFEGRTELPGPPPTFFFAPTRVTKRSADWGGAGLEQRVAEAWQPFCAWCEGWLEPDERDGWDEVQKAYLEVLEGDVPPNRAAVLTV